MSTASAQERRIPITKRSASLLSPRIELDCVNEGIETTPSSEDTKFAKTLVSSSRSGPPYAASSTEPSGIAGESSLSTSSSSGS
jgi:hypothetical protein